MPKYIIAVGSNIEPTQHIKHAFTYIKKIDINASIAKLLYTKAVGYTDQADFINTAFSLNSALTASELKQQLLIIEERLNRVRTSNKNGPRTIDLDIVKIDQNIVDDDYYHYDFVKTCVDELSADEIS
jgi:2-amino-4-hydroxy-6-hydroxymethyldihydropteridine diphosphokinase